MHFLFNCKDCGPPQRLPTTYPALGKSVLASDTAKPCSVLIAPLAGGSRGQVGYAGTCAHRHAAVVCRTHESESKRELREVVWPQC